MTSRTVPISTMRPAYMTAMRSATSTATEMSCVTKIIGQAELALQLAQQQQDLHLHGGIERGRRLVGEQDAAAGTTSASAIMARWRMPPDISCG